MIDLDGTPTKSRLGANAILGVSMAASAGVCRVVEKAAVRASGEPPVDRGKSGYCRFR
jgi:enolase